MLQQVMTAPGMIEFKEVPIPVIGDDQVLIRIEKIGICGSDIHVYHGKHPFTKYPVTQGHEVSGIIEKTGLKVTGLKTGQKVTIEPQVVCGKCYPCLHGKYNLCEELKVMGFQTTGTASHFFCIDSRKVTLLPDRLTLEDGALIEPLAVAVHANKQAGKISEKDIIVIGAGPIGNLVAQTAKGLGARKVMITDISDYRLELAKKCGIDFCVNSEKEDFSSAINVVFGSDKADFIFDCAGNNSSIGQAITFARKGSIIILVAVFSDIASIDLALINDHELDIRSSMMYRHEDYLLAIKLVSENKVNLRELVSKRFAFREYLRAYEYIEVNREMTMKVLINVQE